MIPAAIPRDGARAVRSIRVVLAEEQILLQRAIDAALAAGGIEVVAHAGGGENLLRKVLGHRPDVAIIDFCEAATERALTVAYQIRSRYPEVGVLILAEHVPDRGAPELLALGPEHLGYLLKHRMSDPGELVDAVRWLAQGNSVLDGIVASQITKREPSPVDPLSTREREVLALMCEGLSNQAIAARLVVTKRTVEKHVASIYTRLNLPANADLERRVLVVKTALRAGLERGSPPVRLAG